MNQNRLDKKKLIPNKHGLFTLDKNLQCDGGEKEFLLITQVR